MYDFVFVLNLFFDVDYVGIKYGVVEFFEYFFLNDYVGDICFVFDCYKYDVFG